MGRLWFAVLQLARVPQAFVCDVNGEGMKHFGLTREELQLCLTRSGLVCLKCRQPSLCCVHSGCRLFGQLWLVVCFAVAFSGLLSLLVVLLLGGFGVCNP